MKHKPLIQNFWDKVIKTDKCWKWKGKPGHHGYGRIRCLDKDYAAHRLSWEIHYGSIPEGFCVCHKCDNPPCTNPKHLFLGTHTDNQHDCYLKKRRAYSEKNGKYTRPDRTPVGEKHGRAKLKESDIKKIRSLKNKISQTAIAHIFNTPQTNISLILNNKAWKHIQ